MLGGNKLTHVAEITGPHVAEITGAEIQPFFYPQLYTVLLCKITGGFTNAGTSQNSPDCSSSDGELLLHSLAHA